MSRQPLGIFDSGFGGLTVLRAITDLLPNEDLVYFGDSARYPYGPKSKEQIVDYSVEIARFLVERFDVKMLVVACNTASAFALPELEQTLEIPVVGMIEPGARALASQGTGERIGVIGTIGTISSGAYQQKLRELAPDKALTCAATPGFVEFVERGEVDSEQLLVLAERLLRPIADAKAESLLLGCTHYPFIARCIQSVLGTQVLLVSSAEETAFQVRNDLFSLSIRSETNDPGQIIYLTTGDVEEFKRIGKNLLGIDLKNVLRPW